MSPNGERGRTILPTLVVSVLAVLVAAPSSLSIMPLMDGWIAFPLGLTDVIPYRDYSLPVPPLLYFEAQLAQFTESPLFAFRMGALLILGPALGISLFLLLRLFASVFWSILLTVVGIQIILSPSLEALGGWNTQYQVWLIAFFTAAILSWKRLLSQPVYSVTPSTALLTLGAGVLASLAMLTKHTALVPIVFAIAAITGVSIAFLGIGWKRCVWWFGFLSLGALMPTALTATWLVQNNALHGFVNELISGGGKNPDAIGLGIQLIHTFVSSISMNSVLPILLVFALALSWRLRGRVVVRNWTTRDGEFLFAIFYFLYANALFRFLLGNEFPQALVLGLAIVSSVLSYVFLVGSRENFRRGNFILGFAISAFAMALSFATGRSSLESLFDPLTRLLTTFGFWSLIAVIIMISMRAKAVGVTTSTSHPQAVLDVSVFAFLVGGTLGNLSGVASSGGTVYPMWFVPLILVVLAVISRYLRQSRILAGLESVLFSVVLLWVLILGARLVYQPYVWFNWVEPSLTSSKVVSEVPELDGFRLAVETENFFREFRAQADELKAEFPEKDPTIFVYGNAPLLTAISGAKPYESVRCPVPWFDLCTNETILADLETFNSDTPDILVTVDYPEAIVRLNEDVFVRGEAAHREWVKSIDQRVDDGSLELVGSFPLSGGGPNLWSINVYRSVASGS